MREYGIDLREALRDDGLSWRRFIALLRGLSPQSAYANAIAYRRHKSDRGGGETRRITDPQEATMYLRGLATKKAG